MYSRNCFQDFLTKFKDSHVIIKDKEINIIENLFRDFEISSFIYNEFFNIFSMLEISLKEVANFSHKQISKKTQPEDSLFYNEKFVTHNIFFEKESNKKISKVKLKKGNYIFFPIEKHINCKNNAKVFLKNLIFFEPNFTVIYNKNYNKFNEIVKNKNVRVTYNLKNINSIEEIVIIEVFNPILEFENENCNVEISTDFSIQVVYFPNISSYSFVLEEREKYSRGMDSKISYRIWKEVDALHNISLFATLGFSDFQEVIISGLIFNGCSNQDRDGRILFPLIKKEISPVSIYDEIYGNVISIEDKKVIPVLGHDFIKGLTTFNFSEDLISFIALMRM